MMRFEDPYVGIVGILFAATTSIIVNTKITTLNALIIINYCPSPCLFFNFF